MKKSSSGKLHIGNFTFVKPAGLHGKNYAGYFKLCMAFCEAVESANMDHIVTALETMKIGLAHDFGEQAAFTMTLERLELPSEGQIMALIAARQVGVDCRINIEDVEEAPHSIQRAVRYREPVALAA